MKKSSLSVTVAIILSLTLLFGCASSTASNTESAETSSTQNVEHSSEASTVPNQSGTVKYPTRDINGIITFGAGGGTDAASRALAVGAQKALGVSIVMQNKTGSSGAIAAQYVLGQPTDGYTVLMHSETLGAYRVTGTSKIDYDDFKEIITFGWTAPVLVVKPDSPYNTYEEFLAAAKKNPGNITLNSTGVTGLPRMVTAMMKKTDGLEFNLVDFADDGACNTAVMGGHIDASIGTTSTVTSLIKAGKLKALVVFNNERLSALKDVPCITEFNQDYAKYLPYGPLFGVSVRAGTPQNIVNKLTEAFEAGLKNKAFTDYVESSGISSLDLTGDKATEYLKKQQSIQCYLMYDTGLTKIDPATLGIKRSE
jgi:tripartite-type tricarboxylate transporter receptor subunit TctC